MVAILIASIVCARVDALCSHAEADCGKAPALKEGAGVERVH